ncbi:MAG: DUF4384 domain-containing protein [Bauldia sp.]
MHVRAVGHGVPPRPDDIPVALRQPSFAAPSAFAALATADGFPVDVVLAARWRVVDAEAFLGSIGDRPLLETGRLDAAAVGEAIAVLRREAMAAAVATAPFTRRPADSGAPDAWRQAIDMSSVGLRLEDATVIGFESAEGEARLAAAERIEAEARRSIEATEAAAIEAGRIDAETNVERAKARRTAAKLEADIERLALERRMRDEELAATIARLAERTARTATVGGSAGPAAAEAAAAPRDSLAAMARARAKHSGNRLELVREGGTAAADVVDIGDPLRFCATAADYGHLTLIANVSSGRAQLLLPNGRVAPGDAFVQPERPLRFPGDGLMPGFVLRERGPVGVTEMIAVVTEDALVEDDSDILAEARAGKGFPYLSDAGLALLAAKLARLPTDGWSAATLGFEVRVAGRRRHG